MPLADTSKEQVNSIDLEGSLEVDPLRMLNDKITQLSSKFHQQEDYLKKFQDAIAENNSKNDALVNLIHEYENEESELDMSKQRDSGMYTSYDFQYSGLSPTRLRREYSEFIGSIDLLDSMEESEYYFDRFPQEKERFRVSERKRKYAVRGKRRGPWKKPFAYQGLFESHILALKF